MVFDIVSPLSVRVFAALAIASFLLFTTYTASSEPVLRAVLDAHDVRAPLASIASIRWTFLSDTYTDVALSAISALGAAVIKLGHDILNVVPSPLLQLANLLTASAKLYVPPPMAQLDALGSGIVTGSRRIASDYPGTRLVDYFRLFAGFRADILSATFSVSHLCGTLASFLICFIVYSLWIFFSLEAPLDDNDLRLITTLNTQVTRAIHKIELLSKRVQLCFSRTFASLCAFFALWPTQVLRASCYSRRSTYLQDTLGDLRCNRDSPFGFYRQHYRSVLISLSRLASLAMVICIIALFIAYILLFLHAIWRSYLSSNVALAPIPLQQTLSTPIIEYPDSPAVLPTSSSSLVYAVSDFTQFGQSQKELYHLKANTLSPHFIEDYTIHPDFAAQYELGAELGAGGNGFVLQARRRSDGKDVAVKFVLKHNRAERWAVHPKYGPVTRDVTIMDLTKHKNIASLLDVFGDEDYLYIVQELYGTVWYPSNEEDQQWYPNGSRCLDGFLSQYGPLPLGWAKHIFYQLVDALEHLHSQGIAHCDIKPSNIIVDSDLKVTLIDFGNVLRRPPSIPLGEGRVVWDETSRYCGTRSYYPPEIVNGEEFEAEAADIWALGMVLCRMLVGQSPFHTDDDLRQGLMQYDVDCHYWEALIPMWDVVSSCLDLCFLLRPTAAELQLRDGFLPIALRRQTFGINERVQVWRRLNC